MNIFGPDPAKGGTTARPARSIAANALDHWFNTCLNPNDPTATKLVADWFNDVIGELRTMVRSSGVTENEAADDLIAETLARYASLGVSGVATGTANAITVTALGTTVVPKALFDGMMVETIPTLTNTSSAVTANVFGLGNKKVLRFSGAPAQPGDITANMRTAWRYSPIADGGAGAWLITPWALALIGLDRMPIFPEIDTAGNTLSITATTGQVEINPNQVFRHRGHRVINTADTVAGGRTFATIANRTYHLRWTWNPATSSGAYSLVDLTTASPAETAAQYDSTYDMMLIAIVTTNGANLPTVAPLRNQHRLMAQGELLFNDVTWAGDLVAPSAMVHGTVVTTNWARRPQAAMAMMTSISTVATSDTLGTQQINVGVNVRSRYTSLVTYQKTQTPQSGYVSYEMWA